MDGDPKPILPGSGLGSMLTSLGYGCNASNDGDSSTNCGSSSAYPSSSSSSSDSNDSSASCSNANAEPDVDPDGLDPERLWDAGRSNDSSSVPGRYEPELRLYRSGALKLVGRLEAGEGESEDWGSEDARRAFSRAAARVVRFSRSED